MADTRAETIYLAAALICAAGGACSDYRRRRIPNAWTAPCAIAGLLLHGWLGGWREMATALLAASLAGTVFLLFYLAGGMGGGDVKLIAAVSACAGLSHVAAILIATALMGGVFALVVALAARRLRQTLANVGRLLAHHGGSGLQPHPELNLAHSQAHRLPYGLAIAAGTALTFSAAWLGH
jgi:prepilin peptidase CpaA